MKLLIDTVLPATLTADAPAGIDFERWKKSDGQNDSDLLYYAAKEGFRGVVFLDRISLEQPGMRQLAKELGIALIAIDASDPIQARERLIRHSARLRRKLGESQFVLILGSEVRSMGE